VLFYSRLEQETFAADAKLHLKLLLCRKFRSRDARYIIEEAVQEIVHAEN